MKLVKKPKYIQSLAKILFIIKQDKISAVKKFEKNLNEKLQLLKSNPLMCRKSYYFEDESYRDLIYQGYTIIYKVFKDEIHILEIFKWQNK